MSGKRPDLLRDPVPGTLLRLVGPMMVGALGIVMFNLVDTFFVGRLGAVQLAAMSFTFPIILVAGSVASGIGIGTSATVSRALGSGDRARAERLTLHAVTLAFAIVTVLAVAGLLTITPLFRALGAEDEVLGYIRSYITIWYVGMPFMVVPMVGQNVLQANGDTKLPAKIIIAAVTLNMILDPLLIFGLGPVPAMGIRGAAVATVIARGSTFFIVAWALVARERLIRRPLDFRGFLRSSGSILYVGLPAALTNLALPISMGIVTRLVSTYGALSVAGFGVATRVQTFALIFTMALSMVFTPFVGQNFGAGNIDRVRRGFSFSALMSVTWGFTAMAFFFLAGRSVAQVFNDTPEVVRAATLYLWIVSPSFGFQGIVNVGAAAFNGVHRPFSATGLAVTRLFVLYVPFAFLGRLVGDLPGLFVGLAVADATAGGVAFFWVRGAVCRRNGCVDTGDDRPTGEPPMQPETSDGAAPRGVNPESA